VRLPFPSRYAWLAVLCTTLATGVRVHSQTPPGQLLPPGGGLVIYKEQAFLADNLAGAMIYAKSVPRGPTTTLFVGAGGEQAIAPSDGILEVIASEDINVSDLSPGPNLNQYKGTLGRLEELSRLNAQVASVTAPVLGQMRANVQMVEGGKSLVNGEWIIQTNQSGVPQPNLKTLTTTDGDTYKDATYKSSDDKKVSFSHADGAASISWDKLRQEDQLAWGFDAEKLRTEKLAAEQKVAAELLAQKKAEAEKLAAEQKAAQERAAAEQKIAQEKAAADALALAAAREKKAEESGQQTAQAQLSGQEEENLKSLWAQNLTEHMQDIFHHFHPTGTAKSVKVNEVACTLKRDGSVRQATVRFTLYWEGPVTKDGYTQIELVYDVEIDRVIAERVLITNGLTNSDIGNAVIKGLGIYMQYNAEKEGAEQAVQSQLNGQQ